MEIKNVESTVGEFTGFRTLRGRKSKGSSPSGATGTIVTFPALFTDVLEEYLEKTPNFRERTVDDYRNHARYFLAWAADEGFDPLTMKDLTQDLLVEYRHFMVSEYAPSTVNIRLSTLKAFLAWAHGNGNLNLDLHSTITKVKVDEDDFRFFTEQQMKHLLKIPSKKTYLGFRNYCMMLVMLDNGIRVKELLSLEWSDIHFEEMEIRLTGSKTKNRHFRKVPISSYTAQQLKELKKDTKHFFPEANHVFVSNTGKKLDPSTVRHFLREYGSEAGIEGACSPHMFRHTFARLYVLEGANVFDLQEVLGHSTLEMSRRYVRFFSKEISQKHMKCSPVNRIVGTIKGR